jgi:protein-disulfide isomerase
MSTTLRVPVTPQEHIQGSVDAPVVVVEYGDYECPHCARAHPILRQLQRMFGDRLGVVFRNFPLTEIHRHALHAAQAAESVGAQLGNTGYWRMHDAIFEHQRESPTALSDGSLLRYGAAVGADPAVIERDLESGAFVDRIQADFSSGVRSGVNGTPTFFVNGERYDGDWTDVDAFAIDLTRQTMAGSDRPGAAARRTSYENRV